MLFFITALLDATTYFWNKVFQPCHVDFSSGCLLQWLLRDKKWNF